MALEEARAVVEAAERARVEACGKAVERVLAEHGCRLDCSITLSSRGIVPQVVIVPAQSRAGGMEGGN